MINNEPQKPKCKQGIQSTQSNPRKVYNAQKSIFKALSDGQWHQKKELNNTTKLNFRTLDKHLTIMTKNQQIEKKTDIKNGKYAILYKAEPDTLSHIELYKLNEGFEKNIDTMLEETGNNPLIILDMIHQLNQLAFMIMPRTNTKKQTNHHLGRPRLSRKKLTWKYHAKS